MKNSLENSYKPLIKIKGIKRTEAESIDFIISGECGVYKYIKRVLIENHCYCDFLDKYNGIVINSYGKDANDFYCCKFQVADGKVVIGGDTAHQLFFKRTYYEPDINLESLIILIYSIAKFDYKGMSIESIARHISCEISDYEKHNLI